MKSMNLISKLFDSIHTIGKPLPEMYKIDKTDYNVRYHISKRTLSLSSSYFRYSTSV